MPFFILSFFFFFFNFHHITFLCFLIILFSYNKPQPHSVPSLHSILSPQLPFSHIYCSSVFLQKLVGLPRISRENSTRRCNKTRNRPLYQSWLQQLRRKKVLKVDKKSEMPLLPRQSFLNAYNENISSMSIFLNVTYTYFAKNSLSLS